MILITPFIHTYCSGSTYVKRYKTALHTENPRYYATFNFIKQLTFSLREAINHKSSFISSFKQSTTTRMCTCTHGRQTGGEEINQTVTFQPRFAYKRFMQQPP